MNLHRSILPALAAFVLTVPAFAGETQMDREMDKLNKALKAVGEKVDDAKAKGVNLSKIEEAKRAAEAASKLKPEKTKDIPAADKAKFLADFKASMEETIKTLEELKTAVAAGNSDEAKKVMEKLKGQKGEGHKQFKKD